MHVIKAPDPKLRVKTTPVKKVNTALLQTITDMIKLTKTFVDPDGVGLASTQIGESEQYFILKQDDDTFITVFNPKILSYSKRTKLFLEGCLSIPNYWGQTVRPIFIKVSYMDESGSTIKKRLTGTEAWIFQHEYDHLQGRLFMDLVHEQKGRLFKVTGKDPAGMDVFEEVAL